MGFLTHERRSGLTVGNLAIEVKFVKFWFSSTIRYESYSEVWNIVTWFQPDVLIFDYRWWTYRCWQRCWQQPQVCIVVLQPRPKTNFEGDETAIVSCDTDRIDEGLMPLACYGWYLLIHYQMHHFGCEDIKLVTKSLMIPWKKKKKLWNSKQYNYD